MTAPDGASPASTLRVVVADDHPLFLEGIAALVRADEQLQLVGQASSADLLLERVQTCAPDVVVTDLAMPGPSGAAMIQTMMDRQPGLRILVLTMHDEDRAISTALAAGAAGYALKESPPTTIRQAIWSVGHGMTVFGPGVRVASANRHEHSPAATAFPELTARECEVVTHVAAGSTNLAIARALGLSEKTVRNNISGVLAKLRLVDRRALIERARTAGLG